MAPLLEAVSLLGEEVGTIDGLRVSVVSGGRKLHRFGGGKLHTC